MKKTAFIFILLLTSVFLLGVFVGCNQTQTDLDFSDYSMNCLGDSITYGYVPKSGGVQMERPYPAQLKEYLGLKKARNYGVSGATLSVNTADRVILSQSYLDMDDDAQIISVMGGCNDFERGLPLGNVNDTQNSTVYGALDVLARGLKSKYPNAFIFFMTTFQVGDYLPAVNSAGYTLQDVADAVIEVCAKYGIPVLDMYREGRFELEMNTEASDGSHPSQEFLEKYTVPQIARFLENHYDELPKKGKR